MINLNVKNSGCSKETSCKSYFFIFFCNSIDYNVFVNMAILKSLIIIVGEFVSVFLENRFKI